MVRDPADAARCLDELLATGASVNCYLFHGGSNFGFTNGANDKHTYRPTVTSYDYDAPLDEAGDPTAKYHAFREVIARYAPVPAEPAPRPAAKLHRPGVALTWSAPLLERLDALGSPVASDRPLTMEQLGQDFGFVLYQTVLRTHGPALLEIGAVRDRAQVFLDGQPVGVLERESHEHALAFTVPRQGAVLSLLVENQGRVNYGVGLHDRKGLPEPVTLNGTELAGWHNRPLPLRSLDAVVFTENGPDTCPVGPTFHRGTIDIDEPADTYLTPTGWTKGNAWINGFHLGRYWARGPQCSLFVPAPVLRRGSNEIVLLELHAAAGRRTVDLCDTPTAGPVQE